MITIMRKYIVRIWREFNFALDHFFPKRFKYIFYITLLLPYSTSALGKLFYYLYPIEVAYRFDLDLFAINVLWIFFIMSYKFTELIKNAWKTKSY